MSNLFKKLMDNAKQTELAFGIHENCFLLGVSNDKRLNSKDNKPIKKVCYTTIGKMDAAGKLIGQREFSWYDLDPAVSNENDPYEAVFNQIFQWMNVIYAFFPDPEQRSQINAAFDELLESHGITDRSTLVAELQAMAKDNVKAFANLYTDFQSTYVAVMTNVLNDRSALVRAKVVYEPKGEYLQQPRFDEFVESMSVKNTRLMITEKENEARVKAANPAPKEVAKKPTGNKI